MPFPLDEKYIIQTEEKLSVRFPDSFRIKMIIENGGELETKITDWVLHPVFDTSDKKRIKRTSNDIIRETASAKEWIGFPENAVAIGINAFGDCLILLTSKSDPNVLDNPVYFWDHETGHVKKFAQPDVVTSV